jgi:hypothetical protein
MGSPGCRSQRLPGRRSRKRLNHKEPDRRDPVASRQHDRTSSRLRSINCRANQHPPCLPKTIGRHWQTRQSWQTWHAWIPYSLTTNSNRRNNLRLLSPKTCFATPCPHATVFEKTGQDHRMSRIDRIKRKATSLHAPTPRFFIPSIRAILSSCQKRKQTKLSNPNRLTTAVAKNAFRDRTPHATQFAPSLVAAGLSTKTDCAQVGQLNSVGPLGQHGPLAKTRASASRLCRLCRLSLHRRRQWRRRRDDLLFLVA